MTRFQAKMLAHVMHFLTLPFEPTCTPAAFLHLSLSSPQPRFLPEHLKLAIDIFLVLQLLLQGMLESNNRMAAEGASVEAYK